MFDWLVKLFDRTPKACELCQKPLEKGKYHRLDSTYRGLRPDGKKTGEKQVLCTNCLMRKYEEYLKEYSGKAIIVTPYSKIKNFVVISKGYRFYSWSDMIKYQYNEKTISELKALLSQSEKQCVACDKPARFLLFPPEVYDYDPIAMIMNPSIKGKWKCAAHATDEISKKINQDGVFFTTEVWPPVGASDGIVIPFEV